VRVLTQIDMTQSSCRSLIRMHRDLDGDQESDGCSSRADLPRTMKGWRQRCESGYIDADNFAQSPCRSYLGWSRIRAGIEGASLPAGLVIAVEHGLPSAHWTMPSVFHKAPMNEGRDMEKIISENEDAYEAAYKVMYRKEAKRSSWKEIEREAYRVLELNRRKPDKAKDIKTYGSRISDAVVAAVNEAAKAFPKGTKERSDRD
jgi:hypothetical protein